MNINNKTLAILIMAGMLFSVLTLTLRLTINEYDTGTGLATGDTNATVQFEIGSNVDINFSTDIINFGSGSVVSGQICNVYSNGTADSGCNDFAPLDQGLILENIGNTNASITLNFQTAQATFFDQTNGTADIGILVTNETASSCNSTSYSSYTEIPSYQSAFEICANLAEPNIVTNSSIRIDVQLILDEDVRTSETSTMDILAEATQV
jgi:hypothetical protein